MNAHQQSCPYDLTVNHEGYVSIWAGIVPLNAIPNDYFEERYCEDGNTHLTKFYGDFDFHSHDHDKVDSNCYTKCSRSFERLIGECSFSESYVAAATERARAIGVETTQQVMLLYDFRYDLNPSMILKSLNMQFIGSFPYDAASASAFEHNWDED